MKKMLLLLALVIFGVKVFAQHPRACTAADVMQIATSSDTVYVFNFWATWCVPCVQELPEFNKLSERFSGKPVRFIMVSLDFKTDYPNKLEVFVARKKMQQEIVWLMDTDPNVFIPKIDESWEGSIPATLIVQPGRFRKFIEGQITESQVVRVINNITE